MKKKQKVVENLTLDKRIKRDLKGWTLKVKRYAKPDKRKSIVQMLNTFLPYVGLWFLMYYSLDYSYWITLGLAVVAAFFTVRIFIIQHDCGHRNYFNRNWMNSFVGNFCSLFSSIPYQYWADNHNFHHVHSGKLETRDIGDIDTLTVREYRMSNSWERFKYRMFRSPIVMFVIGPMYYLSVVNRLPLVEVRSLVKTFKDLVLSNALLIGVYVLMGTWLGWKNFLMIQIPVTVFFGIIAVWFFFVQHQHEYTYKQWQKNWDYLLSAIRGSTYYKLPKIVHWLTGNIGYHHIHHLSSGIPNYNLKKCADENPIFQKYVTIITFWQSLKIMNHKLWDEEEERMITFREFREKEVLRLA